VVLEEPGGYDPEHPLLLSLYKKQVEIIRAIADGILDIQLEQDMEVSDMEVDILHRSLNFLKNLGIS
jgi:hypothetical protein